MEMRRFGATGLYVSMLGLGAAEIGFENTSDRNVDTLLGVALDEGINVIDSAAMYADSEAKLGRALSGRRDQFFVFTKCGRHLPPKNNPTGFLLRVQRKLRPGQEREDYSWHPRALLWNIEESLRRLKTECLDLIQLHSCSEETLRQGEVIEVLERSRRSGKARYIGYSGDGPAARYAIGCEHFDTLQVSINLADQEAVENLIPLARRRDLGVIAKRPIANVVWKNAQRPAILNHQPYWDRLRELRYGFLEEERALSTALRFTVSVSGVHVALLGTTNPEHLRQAARLLGAGALDRLQMAAIRDRWNHCRTEDWAGQI